MIRNQTINLVSIFSVTLLFTILLFNWSQLSYVKVFSIIGLMSAFLYFLYQNTKNAMKHRNCDIEPGYYQVKPKKNQIQEDLEEIVRNDSYGSQRSLSKFSYDMYRHSSENQFNLYQRESPTSSQTYIQKKNNLNDQQEQQLRRRQFNLQLPQNINQVVDIIKQNINPDKYYKVFAREVDQVKRAKRSGEVSSFSFYQDLAPNETYCFQGSEKLKFVLTKQYELLINDPVTAVDIVADYFRDKVERVIVNSQNNLKVVSEIMMKCFGMRVNFGINKSSSWSDTKEVTMQQVTQIIISYKRNQTVIRNSKLIIQLKEFIQNYLDRLYLAAAHVTKLLEYIQAPEVMALRIYIDILSGEFRDQRIFMTNELASHSKGVKEIKNLFFVHQNGNRVFFTYNKVNGFKTKNPLVAILGYFLEMYKYGKHSQHGVIKSLKKGITEQFKNE